MEFLITCKSDFENIVSREAGLFRARELKQGAGWLLVEGGDGSLLQNLCFAQYILEAPVVLQSPSVNSFAAQLLEYFGTHLGDRRLTDSWNFLFLTSGNEEFVKHSKTIEKEFLERLKKKMSRVAKLAKEGIPSGNGFAEGFYVHVIGNNQAHVSFHARSQGQKRMAQDPQAPSRSYMKVEEAFYIFGRAPKSGEIVIDLGAAPGGWSLSALKRGAKVIAIDNGPLREPVASHPNIQHLKTDALKYEPSSNSPADWLLCDVLDDPEFIINLLRKWLSHKWCCCFVVNLKVGMGDPVLVLKKLYDAEEGVSKYCQTLIVRQLYHDREEITLMGEVKQ